MNLKALLSLSILFISWNANSSINDGIWKTECRNGLKNEQFYKSTNVLTVEYFYQDSNCQLESYRFNTSGLIFYPSENRLFINFTYKSIELVVFNREVINDLNSRQVCGLSNWQAGQAQNITGLRCALFNANYETQIPYADQMRYGIYLIENNILYYGQIKPDSDGSTPQTRPTQIRKTIQYIFQNSL